MQRSWQIDRSDQFFSKASSTSKHVNCTSLREASEGSKGLKENDILATDK